MIKKKWNELKRYISGWCSGSWDWRWRNFINFIDDPVDDLKHKIHGIRIGKWTFYFPKWLMRGSGDPTK